MESALDHWRTYCLAVGLPWDLDLSSRCSNFLKAVQTANWRVVSDREPLSVVANHVIDSLEPLRLGWSLAEKSVLDIGAGGGFPGIPLLLCGRPGALTLLDSRAKSAIFLRSLRAEVFAPLGGRRWRGPVPAVIHARAESVAHNANYRGSFDIVVSRAVTHLAEVLELSAPFLVVGGHILAYKGPLTEEEENAGKHAASVLGLEHVKTEQYRLWRTERERRLLVYRVVTATPEKYPRLGSRRWSFS